MCVVHKESCRCFSVDCVGRHQWCVRFRDGTVVASVCSEKVAEHIRELLNLRLEFAALVHEVGWSLGRLAGVMAREWERKVQEAKDGKLETVLRGEQLADTRTSQGRDEAESGGLGCGD